MTKDKDFLKDFAEKDRKPIGSKYTVSHDRWDFDDWNAILLELRELWKADDQLAGYTPTGHEAMADSFFSLRKARVELRGQGDIRPSYAVNRAIMDEATQLKEYGELRIHSVGDVIGAGLACVAMEPELEILFDKLKSEQDKASAIEEMLQEMEGLEDQEGDLEAMIQSLIEGGGGKTRKLKSAQERLNKVQEAMEVLKQRLAEEQSQLAEDLKNKGSVIRNQIRKATEAALENASDMDAMELSWGLERGSLIKLPAQKRIEMARRMNTPKFKRLARLIGPMVRAAIAEQNRKVQYAREEIYDLELGNDLSVLLPNEFLYLADDELEWDFYRRFVAYELNQYKLRGEERVAKGGIILLEDGSGSMAGEREVSAKAVGLALLQIARRQHREFYGVHFGSPNEYKTFSFVPKSQICTSYYRGDYEDMDVLEGVMQYAELFFGGGTDYVTPISVALNKLQEQYNKTGAVGGDVVFVTDDECDVSDEFKEMLQAEKKRLGFRIFGVAVGSCAADSEPMYSICDGRTLHVESLLTPDDLRPIFGAV